MLVFACMPLCTSLWSKVQVYAATDIENVSISNSDFDSSSSSSLQTSPSGWTAIGQSDNIKKGVISVDETDFSNNKSSYGLETNQNPGRGGTVSSDKHVLMINAKNNYAQSGFESNSASTLDANSFYVVAINTKTSSSFASIYVDGLVENNDSSNCYNEIVFPQWTKLYFFIQTGSVSKDAKIQLYLGSKSTPSTSVVFFDNIEFFKTSEKSFNNLLAQQVAENASRADSEKTYREINLNADVVDITNKITANQNFNNSSISVFSPVSEAVAKFVDVSENPKYSNLSSNNNFAFSIKNEQKSYSCYEIKDIVIPAYGVYALSIDAKIIESLSSSNATLKLVESDDIKDEYSSYEPKSVELNISSNTNATKNDFNTYTFFVKGNGLVDTKLSLQVSLGTSEEKATGEIALDDIKFVSTTSKEMDAASGNFQKTLELNLASSSPLISNGHFNDYTVEKAVEFVDGKPNYSFPFGVKSWTNDVDANVNKNDVAFGIINTKSTLFNSSTGTANPLNPGLNIDESNNMLMFKNEASTHQSASLSSISLEASSVYEFTFDVNTELNAGAMSFSVLSDGKAISSFSSISTNGAWKNYKVAIRTNSASIEIGVKFDFGTEKQNAMGFGFVDNVRLVKKTLTEEQFLALANVTNTKIVDFEKGNWNIVGDTQNAFGVWELVTASTTLADNAFAGVVAGKDNAFGVTSANEKNMLVVSNPEQGTSSITTKNDFHFASGKFYKVSINILTQRVVALEQNDDEEKIPFGASIKLSGFDAKLENIVTDGEFKTFVFLVKATEDSDQGLTLTLSSPTSTTLGTVIADNLVVEELEESLFNEAVEQKNSKNQTNVALAQTESEDDETSDDEQETADSGLTSKEIWLLVPSIIFGVAIIVAILAFTLRHIKVKKFEKATQATYNRKSSLEREKAKIEAKKNIDKQIAEQVELKNIVENELKSLEENYQKDLQEFRASGSTSNKMEKEFKSYMNEKSKLDATLSSINEKIKQLENPELLVLEEKKIFLKYQKEQERVERHIKKQTKKLEKDKKKNNK